MNLINSKEKSQDIDNMTRNYTRSRAQVHDHPLEGIVITESDNEFTNEGSPSDNISKKKDNTLKDIDNVDNADIVTVHSSPEKSRN